MSNPVPSTAAYSPSYLPSSPPSNPPASSLAANAVALNELSSATPENSSSLQGRKISLITFRHPLMQRSILTTPPGGVPASDLERTDLMEACRSLCAMTEYKKRPSNPFFVQAPNFCDDY